MVVRAGRRGCALALVTAFLVVAVDGATGKAFGPTSIAAGEGALWVGMGNGRVLALPPALDRVEGKLPASPTGFVHGLTAHYGALWVLRDRLTRLDPRTGTTRDVPGTWSSTAASVVAGAGAIWIADDGSNEILRVDPRRMRVQARIRVPGRARGVAAGEHNVVVVSVPARGLVEGPEGARLLRRVDPATSRLSPPLARVGCDVGVAVGSRAVWTLDACTGSLARRDVRSLQVVRRVRTDVLSQAPALGFGSLWLARRGGTLRIDPATLQIRARIAARSHQVTVGMGSVWALDAGFEDRRAPTIRRIDPQTNRVVAVARLRA